MSLRASRPTPWRPTAAGPTAEQFDLFRDRLAEAGPPPALSVSLGQPGRVSLAAGDRRALATARGRLVLIALVVALAWGAVAGRLAQIAQAGPAEVAASAPIAPALPRRGGILDRAGRVLATSLSTRSVFADPLRVIDPEASADALARLIPGADYATLVRRLGARGRFQWIERNVSPQRALAINALGIPGIEFRRETRRIYPAGRLAAHVVGFTDVDGRGLAGVEQALEPRLIGADQPLALTLDLAVQHVVREELGAAIAAFGGIGGTGIVLEAESGAVRALVSLPDYDPHDPTGAGEEARFNRATLGVYEPGSTFKVINTALALDSGRITLEDRFDAIHPIRVGRFTIDDFHAKRQIMTVAEVFTHSSNIGSVRMVEAVGRPAQQAFLERLGLTRPLDLELPERGQPLVPQPWRDINMMTISYGHGIAVTPLHLAAATAALVNGGVWHPPTLVESRAGREGRQVVSPATSAAIRRLMANVVTNGTGRKARVEGYLVGGKTGTAEKTTGRRYSQDARISSFVGAFPMHRPRFVVLVMVDEPKPNRDSHGYATGGWVAAPAVARIVERLGPLAGIEPVDELAPDIQAAVALFPPGAAPPGLAAPPAVMPAVLAAPEDDDETPPELTPLPSPSGGTRLASFGPDR